MVADLERMSNVAGFTSPFMTLVLQVGKNNKQNRMSSQTGVLLLSMAMAQTR